MEWEQIALDILHSDIFCVFKKMEICEHVCLTPNLLKSYSFIKNKIVLANINRWIITFNYFMQKSMKINSADKELS